MEHRVDEVLPHALGGEVDVGEVPLRRLHRAVGVPLEGVGEAVLQDVVRPAVEVDEVHVDLHAERVRAVVERLEVRVRAVLRVDLVVVGDAVGVLRAAEAACDLARAPPRAVHVAVHLDERRQVDGVDADGAHVVQHLRRRAEVPVAREVAQHDLVDRRPLQVRRRGAHRPPRHSNGGQGRAEQHFSHVRQYSIKRRLRPPPYLKPYKSVNRPMHPASKLFQNGDCLWRRETLYCSHFFRLEGCPSGRWCNLGKVV